MRTESKQYRDRCDSEIRPMHSVESNGKEKHATEKNCFCFTVFSFVSFRKSLLPFNTSCNTVEIILWKKKYGEVTEMKVGDSRRWMLLVKITIEGRESYISSYAVVRT